jgi:hypothetical protein
MSSIAPRDQKIVALAAQLDLNSFRICFQIPSSDGQTMYTTSSDSCTCPARVRCYHQEAVALRLQLAAESEHGTRDAVECWSKQHPSKPTTGRMPRASRED